MILFGKLYSHAYSDESIETECFFLYVLQRVGRTGRAGRTGKSISYVTRSDWGSAAELIKILEEADQEVPVRILFSSFSIKLLTLFNDHSALGRASRHEISF